MSPAIKAKRPALPTPYQELAGLMRETATLASTGALLAWDQETVMPRSAAGFRAKQSALISPLVHERGTSERMGELLAACEEDRSLVGDPVHTASVREMRRDYERAVRLPSDLVRRMTETRALSMEAWRDAREQNDFPAFLPWLRKTIDLNREAADALGTPEGGEPYDALLDGYEPGMTAAEVGRVFGALREGLTPLIDDIAGAERRPDDSLLRLRLPIDQQKAFNRQILERLGFDLRAGRLDVSTHPFCSSIAPGDTRLTTRYREDGFLDALSSTMHEGGHGLYEQGLPAGHFGTPLGESAGLGVHESQSRMWENMVGRSAAFWRWALPLARKAFGSAFDGIDERAAFESANLVRPNLIRVESDEATYNLHIMLRFDLERAMFTGDLAAADLPSAWNDRIQGDLGLEVPDDRLGCLQDVHWSMGAVGYFPTYTLGNIYAAQFWVTASEQLHDLDDHISRGNFEPLLDWLRNNVHRYGRQYPAAVLCERITGRRLDHQPLLEYLNGKLRPLYGV